MKKTNKKGAIEIQFNWIFVLIAGFAIFLFIISLIMSQRDKADESLNLQVINKLASSITGKQQSSNAYNEIETMDTTLQFFCDVDTNYSDFKLKGGNAQSLPFQIIFAPSSLSGTKLQTWTQEFNLPFQITTFLYMTSPSTAYVFYGQDNGQAKELYDEFPGNFTKFMIISEDKIPNDFSKMIVVCFEDNCPTQPPKPKYNMIKINTYGKPTDSVGNISFYKAGTPIEKDVPFITKSAIYGAIFSNDPDYYRCEMNRAMKQFEIKRNLTEERINLMVDSGRLTELCQQTFISSKYSINRMNKIRDFEVLYRLAKNTETGNIDLIYAGCPLIY